MTTSTEPRGRVTFFVRIAADRAAEFLAAYQQIRHLVADGVDGHLTDQICRSDTDPEQWLITSEWETLEHFRVWETSPDHRKLVRPLRECISEARSLRFAILAETTRGNSE